ncbi:hypothetical protein BS78_K097100 [Paspalum vaginatum]|uniref:Uncharacterized protein n=1 Tax=Paspalum vaginatum TaxID=158149 RepID=A0A9W7XBQ7_9POAL|nr:hypothetical protein BS78_K097100 [Paspalum vaginatum]
MAMTMSLSNQKILTPKRLLPINADQALQFETNATPSTSRTKRRKRTKNTVLTTVYTVDVVGLAGDPIEPTLVLTKFRNTVGALVRTWMEPSIFDWRKVPSATKKFLWTELQKEVAKDYALKQFGQAYRRWRSDLNTKYVKQNLTPLNEYGRIMLVQWDEFVRQKMSEKGLELSKLNSVSTKLNVHKPDLGPGGYRAKVPRWNREIEEIIAKGQPDPYEGLNQSIGTKEHRGRVRGISSKLNWKQGFVDDIHMYKKKDRYNQELREAVEKAGLQQTPIGETAQINLSKELALEITSPTPCSLHIPLGIHGRTEEVGTTLAIPTKGTFHGTPIPTSYATI